MLSEHEVAELEKRGLAFLDLLRRGPDDWGRSSALRRRVELDLPPNTYRGRNALEQFLHDPFIEEAYGVGGKIAWGVLSDSEALSLAAKNPRLLIYLKTRVTEHFEAAARATERGELRRHRVFFEQLGKAIHGGRGNPSELHPRRIREWIGERSAVNRELQRLYRHTGAVPLPRFLPVVLRPDDERVTIDDPGWARVAAVEFTAAIFRETPNQIEHLSRPSRQGSKSPKIRAKRRNRGK